MKKLLALSVLVFGVALTAVSGVVPLFLFAPMSMSTLLFNAVDVTAITAYADEHKRPLIATLVNGLDIAKDILVIPNVKNKIQLSKLSVGNGFRPYSSTTEFKKSLTFTDRELSTKTGKRELLIDVKDFKNKHLAWRTSPGNRASKGFKDMDFAPFVWDQVIKGLQREINDETAYFGFDSSATPTFNPAATYTTLLYVKFTQNSVVEYFQNVSGGTTTAGESPDTAPAKWNNVTARAVVPGIKSYIDAAITGGFAVTTTGAITSNSTAIAAFKKLFRSMPVAYQNNGVVINCSFTDAQWLIDGMEDVTKYTMAEVGEMIQNGLIPIPGTNYKGWAKPATWLGTSRRLIAQPLAPGTGMGTNLVMGTDLLSDANDIKQIPALWNEEFGISLDLGFQIQDLDALRLGDQA
ncbi:MAG TPA: hypothetical protein VK658_14840 [Chryseolinea sp.]|nr:hypothetical protein [Chryseolinea sp.]